MCHLAERCHRLGSPPELAVEDPEDPVCLEEERGEDERVAQGHGKPAAE